MIDGGIEFEGESVIYLGTTHTHRVKGVIDPDSGEYIPDATVVGTLYDSNYDAVPGGGFVLNYVPGSDGVYIGRLGADVTRTLEECATYYINTEFSGPIEASPWRTYTAQRMWVL